MQLAVGSNSIELDNEGFLINLNDWSEAVAEAIAQMDGINLTEAHWEIIDVVREFYQIFQISPSMRALVKRIEQVLGTEKGRSIYLLTLFPVSPAKFASKIAGLPKPANCF